MTPKKKNSNNKTDISRWYYCCIFGKDLKLSIIQDSDSDHNKGEFKNNEFFVHLKYVNTNIAKYQREDQVLFF